MFEKEGIKYAIEETVGTECLSMPVDLIQLQDGLKTVFGILKMIERMVFGKVMLSLGKKSNFQRR